MSTSFHDVAAVAVRAGAGAVRHGRSAVIATAERRTHRGRSPSGWLAVTVLGELAEVDAAATDVLAELTEDVEVRVRPAAGDRGTELAARLRDRPQAASRARRLAGRDPQADLRSALRRAKQLVEVGEVLAVDPAPHGRRTATPGGLLLEAWTRRAAGAGVR